MVRYILGIPFAAGVTLSLFFLMRFLVTGEFKPPEEDASVGDIDISREDRDETLRTDDPARQRPERKEPPPPPQTIQAVKPPKADTVQVNLSDLTAVEIDPNAGFTSDSDVQPVVRIEPSYPFKAAERGIEGWVIVKFTITENGTVENAQVVRCIENGSEVSIQSCDFRKEAEKAVNRWKYRPRTEGGTAVSWQDEVMLTFDLEK